jgi:hypothetical protein
MQFRHGGLTLELPNDWMDQSTLLFVAPPTSENVMSTHKVAEQSEAISINFVLAPGDVKALLAEQAEALGANDPGFEILEEGAFSCGLGEGWSYVQRMTIQGIPVRQLTVACPVGPIAVVATAAAPDGRFDDARERLHEILMSISTG